MVCGVDRESMVVDCGNGCVVVPYLLLFWSRDEEEADEETRAGE